MQHLARPAYLVLCVALFGCGTGRVCDVSVCPSGCCDASGVCQSGSAPSACGSNGTTCKSCPVGCGNGLCTDTAGTGGGTGGAGGSSGGTGGTGGTCLSPVITVQGTIPAASAGVNIAYNGVSAVVVRHKRDVDPVEDGCVSVLDLTLTSAGQCALHVVAGGKKLASGALVVKSVELVANSQCPGFLDALEGVYENSGGLTVAEALLSSPTVPGQNTAQACLATTITLKFTGSLSRKTDQALLPVQSAQIVVTGQFSSSGDVALSCPLLCSTDCLPQSYWRDPVTNLKWEQPPRFALPSKEGVWSDAVAYCAALTTGGVTAGTWRMPSIDELRTLVRNNPATQPGGSCKVCSSCAVPCLTFSCGSGCTGASGSSTCVYFPPELGSDCTTPFDQWSSSPVPDQAGKHWSIGFYSASVWSVATTGGVRCVR